MTLLKARIPLGEILLKRELITATELAQALMLQRRYGGRLGDILIGKGVIGYYALYRAVAESYGLPFINLLEKPPDPALSFFADAGTYLQLRLIPWRKEGACTVIAVCEVNVEVMAWIRSRFGINTRLVITSPFDIHKRVESKFGTTLEEASRLSLWQQLPQESARITLYPHQKTALALLIMGLSVWSAINPAQSGLFMLILCHLTYTIIMLFKCVIFESGRRTAPPIGWEHKLASMDTRTLPVYTILVPMYREAASLPSIINHLNRLDYPTGKLDIKLVMEADDHETLEVAYALDPSYQFDIIRVPPGLPRTKPKACNYALRFARGEFLTVFDADDWPEPLQLKKAVYAFRHLPPEVICLQARLNYYNTTDNLLTRFFSLEYTILFNVMLSGLERFGIPIPLGGTSNHIALERLKMLGEWDPYNVTEDADLGTRLAARGYRTAMLDSLTLEEAPNRIKPWISQRSRWIKGYMQTWLVHMRSPIRLYRTLGWRSFIGFQLFIGLSSFTFLTAPVVWTISIGWMLNLVGAYSVAFPPWLVWLTAANLWLNFCSHWYFTLQSLRHYGEQRKSMLAAALLYPFYMILHSIASYKALWQLIFKPHFWEKTTHGLVRTLRLARSSKALAFPRPQPARQ